MEWLFLFVVVVVAAVLFLKSNLSSKANGGDSATVNIEPSVSNL